MANSFNVTGTATLNTSKAEKDLSRFINKAERRKVKLALDDRAFTQPLGRITGAADEFNKSLAASNARVIAFAASAGLMYAVQRALTEVAKSAIEVEKSLADVNVILGATTSNLHKFGRELFSIAGQTGQAFGTVAEAATELARQGLNLEETLKRTRDAMILTRLSGMDAASSVNALTAAMNTFKNTALDTTKIVNKLANVDAAFAVSTTDLAEALKRVGSSALDAGVNFDQLLAMVTAVQQTTARGGPVIGNALKSIFTRIQRTETLDQLERLGFAVRSLDGQTRPAIAIMTELAKKIDTLTQAQKASTTELIGGVFQINVVKAALADLGSEYSIYNNALNVSVDSTNQAIQRNAELNKTLAALVNKTFANVKKAAADIGKLTIAPALGGMLEKVNDLLESFDPQKPEGAGQTIAAGILDGMGKFLKGPGVIIGLAIIGKLLQNFGKFASDSFKEFFNLNEAAKKRVELEKFVNAELMKNEDLTQAILKGELSVADAEKVILTNLKSRVVEQERILKIVQQTSSALQGRGVQVVGQDIGGATAYSVKPPKTKSGGHVPNYANGNIQDLVREELKGASYATGGTKAVIDTLPGLGLHVRNTSESVKNSPIGPFINPPMNSPEGYRHRSEAIRRTGMDPYTLSNGYVPNFARGKGVDKKGSNTKIVRADGNTGVILPTRGNNTDKKLEATTSAVFGATAEAKKFKEAGVEHFVASNVKVAKLKRDKTPTKAFRDILNGIFKNTMPQIGNALAGGDSDITRRGKFFDFFEGEGKGQVEGRIFEAGLNYINGTVGDVARKKPGDTWDFANIQDDLAGLYKVKVGGDYDAKPDVETRANIGSTIKKILTKKGMRMNKKGVKMASQGFIPNFATANLTGVRSGFERQIQSVAAGDIEINKTQGLAARIQSSSLSAPEKAELKNKLNRAKEAQRARKSPKGVTIDGNNLGSMLVPKLGSSAGLGVAKPEAADNEFLRKYLSKHYQAKTGVDFNSLSEAQQNKVMGGTKATFPVLAPIKGGKRNIVDEVQNSMENETQSFVASLIQKGGDLGLIQKNLGTHTSSISSAAGAVFESGIKTAFDLDVGKTNDRFDAVTSPGLKQAFAINTPFGEFKINDDSALRQNMASKVLKQKLDTGVAFGGHIPNFADPNRMREALQGGVPYSQTYRSFVDTPKYTGPVIGNTRDEPTQQALKRAVMMHNDPKNAGRFNDGWIPNFAKDDIMGLGDVSSNLEELRTQLAKTEEEFKDLPGAADDVTESLKKAIKQFEELEESTSKVVEAQKAREKREEKRKEKLARAQQDKRNIDRDIGESGTGGLKRRQQELNEQISEITIPEEADVHGAGLAGGAGTSFTLEEKKKLIAGESPEAIAAARMERDGGTLKTTGTNPATRGKSPSAEQLERERKRQVELAKEMTKQLQDAKESQRKINSSRRKRKSLLNKRTGIEERINRLKQEELQIVDNTVDQRRQAQRMMNASRGGAAPAAMRRSAAASIGSTAAASPLLAGLGFGAAGRDRKNLEAIASGNVTLPSGGMTKEQARGTLDSQSSARQARISSIGMTTAFVAPMVTSSLAKSGAMNQEAADMGGNIAMGVGMGAMAGPYGMLAGGLIGAAMGIGPAVDSMSSEMKEFDKAAEDANEKLTKFNSSTQQYIKDLTNLNEAITDTTGKFSASDIMERQDALQASLIDIPTEFLNKMTSAKGNVQEIQKIFGEIQKDLQNQAKQANSAQALTKQFEDETGFFNIGDQVFEGDDFDLGQEQWFNSIKGAIDMSKLAGKDGKQTADELIKASKNLGNGNEELNTVLKKMGVGPEVIRVLNRAYDENSDNLTALADDFIELAERAQDVGDRTKEITLQQQQYAAQQNKAAKAQQRMNAMMAQSTKLVNQLTNTLSSRFKFINDLAAARTQNQRRLQVNNARGQLRVNAPFIDETTKTSIDSNLKAIELQEKQLKASEDLTRSIRSGLIKNLGDQFNSLTNTIEKTGSMQSDAEQSVNDGLQKQIGQREEVGNVLRDVVTFANSGDKSNKEIAAKITELVRGTTLNSAAQLQITNKVQEALEEGNQKAALMVENHQLETQLLQANNEFQRQIAENSKMLSQFGGIQSFLSGQNSGLEKIQQVFENRNQLSQNQAFPIGGPSGMVRTGQSNLQVLDLLRNFAGLDPKSFPDALRQGAVEGLAASQRDMIDAMRTGLAGTGELDTQTADALNEMERNIFRIADTQVTGVLKDKDPMAGTIDAINLLKAKVASRYDQEESFQNALRNTFNTKSAYLTDPLDKIAAILQDQKDIDATLEEKDALKTLDEDIQKLRQQPETSFDNITDQLALLVRSIPKETRDALGFLSSDALKNMEATPENLKVVKEQRFKMKRFLEGGRDGLGGTETAVFKRFGEISKRLDKLQGFNMGGNVEFRERISEPIITMLKASDITSSATGERVFDGDVGGVDKLVFDAIERQIETAMKAIAYQGEVGEFAEVRISNVKELSDFLVDQKIFKNEDIRDQPATRREIADLTAQLMTRMMQGSVADAGNTRMASLTTEKGADVFAKKITGNHLIGQLKRFYDNAEGMGEAFSVAHKSVTNSYDEIVKKEKERAAQAQKLNDATKELTLTMTQSSVAFQTGEFQKQKAGESSALINTLTSAGMSKKDATDLVKFAPMVDPKTIFDGQGFDQVTRDKAEIQLKALIDTENLLQGSSDRLAILRAESAKLQEQLNIKLQEELDQRRAEAKPKPKPPPPVDFTKFTMGELVTHAEGGLFGDEAINPLAPAEIRRREKIRNKQNKDRKQRFGENYGLFFEDKYDVMFGEGTSKRRTVTKEEDPFGMAPELRQFIESDLDTTSLKDRFAMLKKGGGANNADFIAIRDEMQTAKVNAQNLQAQGKLSKSQRKAMADVQALETGRRLVGKKDGATDQMSQADFAQILQARINQLDKEGLDTTALFTELIDTKFKLNSKDYQDLQRKTIEGLASQVVPEKRKEFEDAVKKAIEDFKKNNKGIPTENIKNLVQATANYQKTLSNYNAGIGTTAGLISAASSKFEAFLAKGKGGDKLIQAREDFIDALSKEDNNLLKRTADLTQQNRDIVGPRNIIAFDTFVKATAEVLQVQVGLGKLSQDQANKALQAKVKLKAMETAGTYSLREFVGVYEELYSTAVGSDERRMAFDELVDSQNAYFDSLEFTLDSTRDAFKAAAENLGGRRGNAASFETEVTGRVDALRKRIGAENVSAADQRLIQQDILARRDADARFSSGRMGSRGLMAQRDKALENARSLGEDSGEAFLDALAARFSYGSDEFNTAIENMSLQLIDSFENNLNDALFSAVTGAKEVKEAFKDMADAMLDEMTKMAIQATTRSIIGGLDIPGLSDRVPQKKAKGGLVTGGSGHRDDVPALLQGGEFVIRKQAVDQFGSGLFKSLNRGYSMGGLVKTMIPDTKQRIHKLDPQRGLSSAMNIGGGGAAFTMRNAFVYDHDTMPTGLSRLEVDSRLSRRSLMDSGNPRNKIRMDKEKGLQDYFMQRKQDIDQFAEEYQDFLDARKARWTQAGLTAGMLLGLNYTNKATGGSIEDTVPALLTSGEYVMSRDAVQQYGVQTMSKLNRGRMPAKFAEGGLVGDSGANNGLSGDSSAGLTNNVNITVNIDNNGSLSANVDSSAQSENVAGSQRQQSRELAKTIESAVIKVITDQKKQGGLLR